MLAYVLQREILSSEKPLYPNSKNRVYPASVLIPDLSVLRRFPRNEILEKSKTQYLVNKDEKIECLWGLKTDAGEIEVLNTEIPHFSSNRESTGLIIPPSVVAYYNLNEGDQVEFTIDRGKRVVVINTVNGFSNLQSVRSWTNIQYLQSDYPIKPLPIEKFGNPDLRAVTLLSPIGLGQSYWIIAPGNSGKTWIMVEMLKACVSLLPDIPNLHLVVGYVGDRPEDAPQYSNVVTEARSPRVEFYQSPWSDQPTNQVEMTKFIINRARRLVSMGKHVVLFFDSISRVVSADTASIGSGGASGGMIRGGIYRQSLSTVIQGFFGIHGCFDENRSLTVIGTVLSSSEESSEAVVDTETSSTSTTGILRLLNNPTLAFPKISVTPTTTYTRFPAGRDFRSEKQIREMEDVKKRIWKEGNRAEAAHQELLKYVQVNPSPQY